MNPAWNTSLLNCPADFRLKAAYNINSNVNLNLQPAKLSYEYQTYQPQQLWIFSGLKQEPFFYISLFYQVTKGGQVGGLSALYNISQG